MPDQDADALLTDPEKVDPTDQAVEPSGAPAEDEADQAADPSQPDGEGDAADELVITIGDDEPPPEDDPAKAPAWVRDLRKANREKDRALREKDAEIARLKGAAPAPAAIVVGEKPTLAGCGYDEPKFEAELQAWHDRKRTVEDEARAKADAEKKAATEWQARLEAHNKAAASLKVKNFEEAQDAAREIFSIVQQGIIIRGTDPETGAKMVAALGMNPKKAKQLAAIADPIQFAVAIGEVKTMLKTAPRKGAPIPERVVRGNAPVSGVVDQKLERLRAEADKTGDRTKVSQYMRQQMQAKRVA